MDIHQLKTFVAVAREKSITRASEVLHLSQPAVSAHIKAIEDTLGLTLFARTPKGMALTPDGERLLPKAEQTIAAHRALLDEASRTTGRLIGKLRLGASTSTSHEAVGKLLTELSARHPEVEVTLEHRTSSEMLFASTGAASPCDISWDAMSGDDRVRRCTVCDRTVYDCATLTRAEIVALLETAGERPCARLFRRRDGTLLTADSERGRGRRRRRVALAVLAVATAAAVPVAGARLAEALRAAAPRDHHLVLGRRSRRCPTST